MGDLQGSQVGFRNGVTHGYAFIFFVRPDGPGLAANSFAWFALLQGTVHKVVLSPGRSQWGQLSASCWTPRILVMSNLVKEYTVDF